MLATILALACLCFLSLQCSKSIESNWRWLFSLLTIVAAALLLLVWLIFFAGLRWRVRLAVLGSVIAAIVGVAQLVRFDGSANGTAFPRITWKWTPKRDGNVGDFTPGDGGKLREVERAVSADYPRFLGRERNAVVAGVELDRDWSAHPPKELWRRPIGLGWSAFAVSGPRALTQEQRGEHELVVCYELATGRPLWAHTNRVCFREQMGGDGPRATPTIVENHVYALGATGILDCLDLTHGRLIWSRDVLGENRASNLMWGKASSPLVSDDLVVVTGGLTNGPSLLAYRRDDGSPAWHSGTNEVAYSSPALATICGKPQVLCLGVAHLAAHDCASGNILWEYHWREAQKSFIASQPLLLEGDRVLLSAGFGAGCVLLQITREGARFSVAEVWKNRNLKTHFSSAVARGGFVYGLDDETLVCLELATGKRQWKDGRYGHGQLMRVGDLLLVQTEPGPVVLVEADPLAYREVARLQALRSKTWNNPALAGEFLLARNDQEAVCYKLPARAFTRAD